VKQYHRHGSFAHQFSQGNDWDFFGPAIGFQLSGYLAIAIEVEHHKVRLEPQRLPEGFFRVTFGHPESCVAQVFHVALKGCTVVDEEDSGGRTS
jgi:hypothetical protein